MIENEEDDRPSPLGWLGFPFRLVAEAYGLDVNRDFEKVLEIAREITGNRNGISGDPE